MCELLSRMWGNTMERNRLTDGSSGVNPLGPSRKIKSTVRKSIKKIGSNPYLEMDALTRFFESKFRISPESVLFANSLRELLYLIPDVLRPKKVLIVGPALEIYADAAEAAGADVSYINAREAEGFAFDISCILKDSIHADLVILANPNRITGRMIPWRELHEAMTVISGRSQHFVIDESMIEFAGLDCHDDTTGIANCTILRTTAFFYGMPGLELAYAISSPEVIHLYKKKRHWDINPLSVEAARTAYRDSTFRKLSKQYILFEKQTLMKMFNKIEWITVYDTDTNIILLKIEKSPDDVARELRSAGLNIRDCRGIKGLDRSFFRVSVMKHENNLKLISLLNGLRQNRQT
jgi:threonine-phosphate decarboxylase